MGGTRDANGRYLGVYGRTNDLDSRAEGECFYGPRLEPPLEIRWKVSRSLGNLDNVVLTHSGVLVSNTKGWMCHVLDEDFYELPKPAGTVGDVWTFGDRYVSFIVDGPVLHDLVERRTLFEGDVSMGGFLGVWVSTGSPRVSYWTHSFELGSGKLVELPFTVLHGNVVAERYYGRIKNADGETQSGCCDLLTGEFLWTSPELIWGLEWADEQSGFLRYRDRVEHVSLANGEKLREIPPEWSNARVQLPYVYANRRVYDFESADFLFSIAEDTWNVSLTDGLLWCSQRLGGRDDKKHYHSLVCYSIEERQEVWRLDLGPTRREAEVHYGMNHAGFFRVDRKSVELFGPA